MAAHMGLPVKPGRSWRFEIRAWTQKCGSVLSGYGVVDPRAYRARPYRVTGLKPVSCVRFDHFVMMIQQGAHGRLA